MADLGADERARQLAEEARPFLAASGFSNERIDDLAHAFVARGLGGDDDFTAWAMSEGWYTAPDWPEQEVADAIEERARGWPARAGGDRVATIHKRLITPLRDRFTVELAGGGELDVEGDILDHEYQITRDGIPVANVSKRWFRVRDTYGVAVAPGQDDALVLAVTVCIDHLTSKDR